MDRLEAMSMLLVVVDQGSLSGASRKLRVPLPTLSRKITDLETALGAKLLTRTTRKLSLTEAGITYVAAVRQILEVVEEAERQAAGEFVAPKGELVVTAPILFGRLHVLPIVAEFLALYPAINVRLVLSDRNVHLVDDHVDMAVRIGALPDSSMVATAVGTMRTVFCASPSLLAGHGIPLKPIDLKQLPCVTLDTPLPSPAWHVRSAGGRLVEIALVPRLTVSTAEAAAAAAISGIGVTRLLHYQVADAVAAGALTLILEAFEPDPSPINLIHGARGQIPLKMRRFLDFAVPRLRDALAKLDG